MFLLFWLIFSSSIVFADPSPEVHVRLEKNLTEVHLVGTGLHVATDVHSSAGWSRLTIKREKRNFTWFWQVAHERGDEKQVRLYAQTFLEVSGQGIHTKGRELPSHLIFSSAEKMNMIGVLPLEDYLVGVVSSEMPLSWPLEALKAQAIAARSYALAVMDERKREFFHLESSVRDQVFRYGNHARLKKVKEAVDQTRGQVLVGSGGKVKKAFYHSDCGGRTASANSVWGKGDIVGGSIDSSCPNERNSGWSYSIRAEELHQRLKKMIGSRNIAVIEPIRLRPEERVASVNLIFDDGGRQNVRAHEFREKLGYVELKSTQFDIEKNAEGWRFIGRGYGHGVGLCQWGSRAMAEQGKSFSEILRHYYPDTTPRVLKYLVKVTP